MWKPLTFGGSFWVFSTNSGLFVPTGFLSCRVPAPIALRQATLIAPAFIDQLDTDRKFFFFLYSLFISVASLASLMWLHSGSFSFFFDLLISISLYLLKVPILLIQ